MIKIGGLQKVSLIDFPGKLAASVFLVGCNLRCPYCHNPELITIDRNHKYFSQKEFFAFLEQRKKVLEGVCVSGGEPLISADIEKFLKRIKKMGFVIKLDTNGTNPKLLATLIRNGLIDYLAMDIKASAEKYQAVTGVKINFDAIKESIKLIKTSGLDYEFRTTVMPKFHDNEEMERIGQLIQGAKNYFIQNFSNRKTLNPEFANERTFTEAELANLQGIVSKYASNCQIRT